MMNYILIGYPVCESVIFLKAHSDTSPNKPASVYNAIIWFPIETVKQVAL